MLDWHLILGIVAGVLSFSAIIPYTISIVRGDTRPNIVSYCIWAILLIISISAQITAGASWSILLLIGDLSGVLLVVTLCLRGFGYKKYGRIEFVCTMLAILAIVLWQITNLPLLAIECAVVADQMAGIPTIAKTYRDPWSEIPYTWLMVAGAAALSIASTTIFNLENLIFPASVFVTNFSVGMIALTRRRKHKKPKNVSYPQQHRRRQAHA